MINILYLIFIAPIKTLLEIVFLLMYRLVGNAGFAIIAVSLVVNILILPMYKKSDKIQEEERAKQKKMSHWIKHIKKSFKGDERFMMLNAYYKEQNYQPLSAVKGSMSLFLQIPFFIAAYSYLSNLSILQGASFGILQDLSKPDQLIQIGSIGINVLPILMTLINWISGVIYTKEAVFKEKAQVFLLGLVFLVFLYDRPAGLVFYWTLNNAFSLIKNIIMKAMPKSYHLSGKIGAFFKEKIPTEKFVALMRIGGNVKSEKKASDRPIYILSALVCVLLWGFMIPLSVISASPVEFVNMQAYVSPLQYVVDAAALSAGIFLVWGFIFFYMGSETTKARWGYALCAISSCFLVNYMFFGRNFGTLSSELQFGSDPSYGAPEIALNIMVNIILVFAIWLLFRYKKYVVKYVLGIVIVGGVVLSIVGIVDVNQSLVSVKAAYEKEVAKEKETQFIKLSKTGQNVVVIMLDRAIGEYIPYIMEEKPELKEVFSGFTYFPNTVSFGAFTNFGTPSLYGGYEYTPVEMNARDQESLKDKQNEALLVMPSLMSENGYDTTVVDPPYANYEWYSDLSIYDDYENVTALHAETGKYMDLLSEDDEQVSTVRPDTLKRNFFFYSVYKSVPLFIQPGVYDDGNYLATSNSAGSESTATDDDSKEDVLTSKKADTIPETFLESYAVLGNLTKVTGVMEDGDNQFLLMRNSVTHEPVPLEAPDYSITGSMQYTGSEEPQVVDGKVMRMDTEDQQNHYDTNMLAMLKLAEWIEYLKEEGVYDNTKIIFVSDHGRNLGQFENESIDGYDIQWVNPLLMMKDFNTEGELLTNETFMTQADVPTLVCNDVIEDPVNPFTGNAINSAEKTAHDQIITFSEKYSTTTNNGNVFDTSDSPWFSVHNNIFDLNNWTNLGQDYSFVGEGY
ncbi:MAG: membrane protein insertase YidC [Hespellia sp.]|nr:membrane protein insertase YidC [Hespellia sp.]